MRRVFRDYVFDGVSRLRGLQLPVDGDEAANKDYVDGVLAGGESTGYYEPLTNGNAASPELIFAEGDVIMVRVFT